MTKLNTKKPLFSIGFKVVLLVLGLLLVCGVAYGEWLIYQEVNLVKHEQASLHSEVETVKEQVRILREQQYSQQAYKSEKVDTSNWQVYRNEEYGFEVKYPPCYYAKLKDKGVLIKSKANNSLYTVTVFDNLLQLTASEYVRKIEARHNEPEAASILSSRPITLNNSEGVDTKMVGAGAFTTRSVYFATQRYIYNIQYGLSVLVLEFNGDKENYDEYLRNGNMIVSTFRVLQTKSETY